MILGESIVVNAPAAELWRQEAGCRLAEALLAWYDRTKRDLPWRRDKNPYRVWLSEIMLQQTQVATVIPYFENFLRRWPSLADLAGAADDDVLKAWEGLGYYSRARHLLAAAQICLDRHQGQIPELEAERLALPGIGEYTAAAIGAIAFGQPVAAVDGNIVRVFARLTATAWQPADLAQRREVRRLAESVLPTERPGDFNEALMDLGATVCLPRQPRCEGCPLRSLCRAAAAGLVEAYPARPAKKARPVESKVVLVMVREDGRVHVRQRPARGLLAGLYEFDWLDGDKADPGYLDVSVTGLGSFVHDFTHKRWLLDGYMVRSASAAGAVAVGDGKWVAAGELAALPFPAALAGYRTQVLALLGKT